MTGSPWPSKHISLSYVYVYTDISYIIHHTSSIPLVSVHATCHMPHAMMWVFGTVATSDVD